MLRCQPIANGQDMGIECVAEESTQRVVRVEVADHEPATVEVDQERAAGCAGTVMSSRQIASLGGNGQLRYPCNTGQSIVDGSLDRRRPRQSSDECEQQLHLGVQHVPSVSYWWTTRQPDLKTWWQPHQSAKQKPSHGCSPAARYRWYSAGRNRDTRRPNAGTDLGQSVEFRPLLSRYQLTHPPLTQTVPRI